MGSEGLHSPHCHTLEMTIKAQQGGTPIHQLGGASTYKAGVAGQLKLWKRRALLTLSGSFIIADRARDQKHGQAKW